MGSVLSGRFELAGGEGRRRSGRVHNRCRCPPRTMYRPAPIAAHCQSGIVCPANVTPCESDGEELVEVVAVEVEVAGASAVMTDEDTSTVPPFGIGPISPEFITMGDGLPRRA